MSEVKEPGVNPIPNKGPRKGVVSKDLFLKVLVAALKKHGVCFKQGTKITESKAKYWDLFILFNKIMMAAAASAGTQVSLSGVGTLLFKESGRSEESVFPRFKYKVSSKSKDFFRDNADMVLPGVEGEDGAMNPPTDEDFIANFLKVMEAIKSRPQTPGRMQ